MTKKLMTRTEFAALAGVSGAAVTKACDKALQPATEGKRIDAAHPAALAYLEKIARDKTPEIAPGVDPMYPEVAEACQKSGRYTENFIRTTFGFGKPRAQRLLALMRGAGLDQSVAMTESRADLIIGADTALTTGGAIYRAGEALHKRAAPHVRGTAARRQNEINNDDGELVPLIPENVAKYADWTLREILEKFGTAARFKDYLQAMKEISMIEDRHVKIGQLKGKLVSRELVQKQIVEPIDAAHIKLLRDGSKTISRRVIALHGADESMVEIERTVEDLIASFIRPVKAKVKTALQKTEPVDVLDDD